MKDNLVIQTMLDHKSIRKYTDETPSEEVIKTIIRASQQAPFASQLYSILLSRNRKRNPWKAPLLFTICVDVHKFERIMTKRNWQIATNDLTLLMFGIQDAALMAQNMVVAGRSLGLGSCWIGFAKVLDRDDYARKLLGIPYSYELAAPIIFGYPLETKKTPERKVKILKWVD